VYAVNGDEEDENAPVSDAGQHEQSSPKAAVEETHKVRAVVREFFCRRRSKF
jgi:hypothetical protein